MEWENRLASLEDLNPGEYAAAAGACWMLDSNWTWDLEKRGRQRRVLDGASENGRGGPEVWCPPGVGLSHNAGGQMWGTGVGGWHGARKQTAVDGAEVHWVKAE